MKNLILFGLSLFTVTTSHAGVLLALDCPGMSLSGQDVLKRSKKVHSLVLIMDDHRARIVDRVANSSLELVEDQSPKETRRFFRTSSITQGIGISVRDSDLEAKTGEDVKVSIFAIVGGFSLNKEKLRCQVTTYSASDLR